jgi:hypothetical protein
MLFWVGVEKVLGRVSPFFCPFIKGMKGVFVRVGLRIFFNLQRGFFLGGLGKGKVSLFFFKGWGKAFQNMLNYY